MSDDSKCEAFQVRVKKLRSLRDQLCSQTSEWSSAFEVRDFVINELQDMHLKLSESDSSVTPEWCKEKVEHILNRVCALPNTTTGDDDA